MTPLFSLSAIRRKFFLCRQAWKNRILVQFFSLMACSKASIPTDIKQVKAAFKNKPAPSELKHRPQFASMVEALQGINEPHAVVVSKPIVGPQVVPAVTQSSILIENFLRPVPQYRDIPCRKQQVTIALTPSNHKQLPVSCALEHNVRSQKHCLGPRILKLVEESVTRHEAGLLKMKNQQAV
jgi:hypothetical protein